MADAVNEQWPNVSAWTENEAGKLEASGGKLFSKSEGLPSAVRAFALTAGEDFRVASSILYKTGGTAGKVVQFGVSTAAGAGTFEEGGKPAWMVIAIDCAGKVKFFKGGSVIKEATLPAGEATYIATIVGDANRVSFTLASLTRSFEFRAVITRAELEANGTVKNLIVLNQDKRGAATGCGIGAIGARKDQQTCETRTNIEDKGIGRSQNSIDAAGRNLRIEWPSQLDTRTAAKFILFAHGVGSAGETGSENGPFEGNPSHNMFTKLLEEGFVVASSDLGGPAVYGNVGSAEATEALYTYINSKFTVSKIVLLGFSGGGATVCVTTKRNLIPIDTVVTLDGFLDVKSMFAAGKWEAEGERRETVKAAYELPAAGTTKPSNAEITEHIETPKLDPVRMTFSEYHGYPFVIAHSPEDKTLAKATHADALDALLTGHQTYLIEKETTGDHATEGNFPLAVGEWITAALASSVVAMDPPLRARLVPRVARARSLR